MYKSLLSQFFSHVLTSAGQSQAVLKYGAHVGLVQEGPGPRVSGPGTLNGYLLPRVLHLVLPNAKPLVLA